MKRIVAQTFMDVAFLAAILLLMAIALCARAYGAETASTPADVDAGRAIVAAHCAGCHATGKQGDSPNGAAPPFRTLSARYPGPALAEAFNNGLIERHPGMPTFRFTHEETTQILDYLLSIQDVRGV